LFPQRILVALKTDQGVEYVTASGWDRVYLFWMFRNFRSLPQNVLSARQKRLIGSLYRETSNYNSDDLHGAVVVGTVEDFRPSSLATLGSKPFYARFTLSRMTLKVATAAVVFAIAILAWHQLGAQSLAGSSSTQIVAASRTNEPVAIASAALVQALPQNVPAPASVEPAANPAVAIPLIDTGSSPEAATAHVGTAAPAVQGSAVPPARSIPQDIAAPAQTLAAVSKPPETAIIHHPVIPSPKVSAAVADSPRVQISGRPQKLVYPVCPETQARGKVSLQAVVGYDGAVSRVRILTGDRTLAAAAIEAVRQWRYEPFSGAAPHLERETNITISFISNEVVAVSFPSSAPLSR
jgi:protein TonB